MLIPLNGWVIRQLFQRSMLVLLPCPASIIKAGR